MNWNDCHNRVDEGVTVGSCRMKLFLYLDDLVLLASCEQGLQQPFDRLAAACDKAWMKISTKKTKVLYLSSNPSQCTLQQVEKFKYIMVELTSDGQWNKKIDAWINKANTVLHELYCSVVTEQELWNTTKLSVFKSVLVLVLTHGHESWAMTDSVISLVEVAEMEFLWRVHSMTLCNKVCSCEICNALNVEPLLRIKRSQLWCFSHTANMPQEKLVEQVLLATSKWKQHRGLPSTRWHDYTWFLSWWGDIRTIIDCWKLGSILNPLPDVALHDQACN